MREGEYGPIHRFRNGSLLFGRRLGVRGRVFRGLLLVRMAHPTHEGRDKGSGRFKEPLIESPLPLGEG